MLIEVDDFNEYFKIGYSIFDVDIIGGIVLYVFGYMLSCGEIIDIDGL